MLKIAVCDDNREVVKQLSEYLQDIETEQSIRMEFYDFFNGEQLLAAFSNDNPFDLLFLDIEMPGMNGVEIGRYIREQKKDFLLQIVYISGMPGYALELFQNRPLDFIVKPISKAKVAKVVNQVCQMLSKTKIYFSCKISKTIQRIPVHKILYFVSQNRQVLAVLDQSELLFYAKLDEVLEQVQHSHFAFTHKSYLVNFNRIQKFTPENIIMDNGDVLPVSRMHKKAIIDVRTQLCKGC